MRSDLEAFDLPHLEAETHTIYALNPNLELGYMNPAWFQFANDNNGSNIANDFALGVSVLIGIAAPLREGFETFLQRAQMTGQPVESNYLCPSPLLSRTFRLRVLPLHTCGLLIHNALLVERPHNDLAHAFDNSYKDERELVVQCCSCRRVRHGTDQNRWDWVPALRESNSETISHTLCAPCLGFSFS